MTSQIRRGECVEPPQFYISPKMGKEVYTSIYILDIYIDLCLTIIKVIHCKNCEERAQKINGIHQKKFPFYPPGEGRKGRGGGEITICGRH